MGKERPRKADLQDDVKLYSQQLSTVLVIIYIMVIIIDHRQGLNYPL